MTALIWVPLLSADGESKDGKGGDVDRPIVERGTLVVVGESKDCKG